MSPEELSEAQSRIDATVIEWPEARVKMTFGHRGFVRNGKMFGFFAEGGLAVKAWASDDAPDLYAHDGVVPFAYNGMPMRAWPILPLRNEAEVETALTALSDAYQRASAT